MPRKDLVCRLRAISAEWKSAVENCERHKLIRLLEELERTTPSSEEIKWSGLNDTFLWKAAQHVMSKPEVIRIQILKDKWRANFLSLPQQSRKLAEPSASEAAYFDAVQDMSHWLTGFVVSFSISE
jgi:hypothetical protein